MTPPEPAAELTLTAIPYAAYWCEVSYGWWRCPREIAAC